MINITANRCIISRTSSLTMSTWLRIHVILAALTAFYLSLLSYALSRLINSEDSTVQFACNRLGFVCLLPVVLI